MQADQHPISRILCLFSLKAVAKCLMEKHTCVSINILMLMVGYHQRNPACKIVTQATAKTTPINPDYTFGISTLTFCDHKKLVDYTKTKHHNIHALNFIQI